MLKIITNDLKNISNFKKYIGFLETEIDSSYLLKDFSLLLKDFKMKNCVDLGSNVGVFAKKASFYFENVYCFEANCFTFYSLINYLYNIEKIYNAKLYNLAVSNSSGNILKINSQISNDIYISGNNSIKVKENNLDYDKVISISLDDIYSLLEIDYIDYLKIDIEGSEYDVLMNKDLSRIGIITGEIHFDCTIENMSYQEQKNMLLSYLEKFFIIKHTEHNFFGINRSFYEKDNKFIQSIEK